MKLQRLNSGVLFGLVWVGCGNSANVRSTDSDAEDRGIVDGSTGVVQRSSNSVEGGAVRVRDAATEVPNIQPPPPSTSAQPPPVAAPAQSPPAAAPAQPLPSGSAQATAGKATAPDTSSAGSATGQPPPKGSATPLHVFVIAMENQDATQVYGSADAPYINNVLLPSYASASNFVDELTGLPSEPHYIEMEAGSNTLAGQTFESDDPPSASNSTGSSEHLATQLVAAGLGWTEYAEAANLSAQPCPIGAVDMYVPRHDPFVFFQDVSGMPPSATNTNCAAHHKPFSALAGDLASGTVASYVFITPDLCDDMHGASACPSSNAVQLGDSWLSSALPPLITYVNSAGGVIFIVWDQGGSDGGSQLPFVAIGPTVKPGYRSSASLTHRSLARTVEEIFGLPILPAVQDSTDLGDLFDSGAVP